MLPSRLRHLRAREPQHAVVGPDARERASGGTRLRDLVLVVGEDQVAAAAVDTELASEELLGHRRALDMPAGTAIAPWRGPGDVLVGLRRLPEREVDGIAFVLAGLDAGSRAQLVGPLAREVAVGGEAAHGEVDVALRLVGVTARDQLLDERDDLGQRLGCERLAVGTADPEPLGVGHVRGRHLAREFVRGHAGPRRGDVDLVVDVSDVLDQRHGLSAPLEVALHQPEHDERAGVADMDAAVDGRPAGVDPDRAVGAGAQLVQLAGAGVAQPHAALRMASSRGSAANTAQSSGPRSRPVSERRAWRSGTCARRSSSTSARACTSSSCSG